MKASEVKEVFVAFEKLKAVGYTPTFSVDDENQPTLVILHAGQIVLSTASVERFIAASAFIYKGMLMLNEAIKTGSVEEELCQIENVISESAKKSLITTDTSADDVESGIASV